MPLDEQCAVSGPVNVVVPVGITDSTELPLMYCAIVNCPSTLLPDTTSVARSVANCVAAFTGTRIVTAARPFWSVCTVTVWAGTVELAAISENVPRTTSKRTERPASVAPPTPVTTTVAVPSWPEQSVASEPAHTGFPVMVIDAGSSSDGLTLTATFACCPEAS